MEVPMKTIIFTFALLSMPLTLAGCKTTAQSEHGKITIEDGNHKGSDFCPPGQAKKGNC